MWYRRLMRLLPEDFRAQHGAEMQEVFAESLKEVAGGGPGAVVGIWVAGVFDVVRQAVLLRVRRPSAFGRGFSAAGLLVEVRYAVRSLVKSPVYAGVSLATLTLGIGATTAVFSGVDTVFFRPPPHVEDPEEIVTVYTSDYSGPQYGASSYPDFQDFLAGAPALEAASTVAMQPVNVAGSDGVTRILMAELVSGNYFRMLGAAPFAGRWFTEEEGEWDSGAAVAVVSHGTWTRMFGADPAVLGREIRVSGRPVTIVGVAPPGLGGGGYLPAVVPDFWLPPATEAVVVGDGAFTSRGSRGRLIRARLADGVTIETAAAQIGTVAARLHDAYPEQWTDVNGDPRRVTVTPDARMFPQLAGPARIFSTLLMSAVGLTLFIACANVATITLVRGRKKARELAVRSAIGAGRARLAGHVLIETAVICAIGGIGGVVLASVATGYLGSGQASFLGMPLSVDISVGPRVVLFAVGVVALTVAAVGLLPALEAMRSDLVSRMRSDTTGAWGRPRGSRARSILVVAQVSASLVLLVGGGLLLRSVQSATSLDLGYETQGLATVTLDLGPEGYEPEEAARFFDELGARIGAHPEVEGTALIDLLPLTGGRRRSIAIEGYTPSEGEDMEFDYFGVGAGLLELVGMEVLEGRSFGPGDASGTAPVVMVNRSFAERFWPEEGAVGRTLTVGGTGATVIGVVADADYRSLDEEARPAFFLSLDQNPVTRATVVARTRPGRDSMLLPSLRDQVRSLDAGVPISSLRTMDDVVASALLPQRVGALLLVAAGGLGLFLSVLGLYGVVAYVVSERTREMGVRMALGAPAASVLRAVLGRGLALATFGVAVGAVIALGVTRFLRSLLFGISPADPAVFAFAAFAVFGVSLLATYVPARRAAAVDPAVTLRSE